MSYKPYTLPKLPRQHCPFECSYEEGPYLVGRDEVYFIKSRFCNKLAQADGWCRDHGYISGVLDLASRLMYPKLQVNKHLWIGRGIANWEGYAVRMPWERSIEVKMAMVRYQQKMAKFNARIRQNGSSHGKDSDIA